MAGSFIFPKSHHLRSRQEFSTVYNARVRHSQGPLTAYIFPNKLGHFRLGISTPKKVGSAPRRNQIKRMIRESFRLLQHDLPGSYDLLIIVRPHGPMELEEYQKVLRELIERLHQVWESSKR